jgi:hypothetical protein
MAPRKAQNSQEGYHSSSPSAETAHDPFSSQTAQRQYYDNEDENEQYSRRDTNESSRAHINDPQYYDNNNYDSYRE